VTGRDIKELKLALAWDPQAARWSVLGDAGDYWQSSRTGGERTMKKDERFTEPNEEKGSIDFLTQGLPRGRVLLVMEDPLHEVMKKLEGAGADPSMIRILPIEEFRALQGSRLPELLEAIQEWSPVLVVIDSYAAAFPITDANNREEVAGFLNPWTEFAHRSGIAVLIVRETQEGEETRPGEVQGSSAFTGVGDVDWTLSNGVKPNERVLKVTRKNARGRPKYPLLDKSLTIAWDGQKYHLVGGGEAGSG
jgi:hypothetical protein